MSRNKPQNAKKAEMRKKNKKSIVYEIIISILSFIFVILTGTFVTVLFEKDYDYKKESDDLYYYMVDEKYYTPYDMYKYTNINTVLGQPEDEDLSMIYAYGRYYMDSFNYNAVKDNEAKDYFKEAMEKDISNMKDISGLTDRIDRLFANGGTYE